MFVWMALLVLISTESIVPGGSLSIPTPALLFQRVLPRLKQPMNPRLKDLSLLLDASREMGVSAPWNAPKFVWSIAWKIHEKLYDFFTIKTDMISFSCIDTIALRTVVYFVS